MVLLFVSFVPFVLFMRVRGSVFLVLLVVLLRGSSWLLVLKGLAVLQGTARSFLLFDLTGL